MEQNIVYAGKTSKEREIIIRYPTLSDAPEMWRYINELSQEKTFVRFQGEEISLEYETKFLNGELEKIKNKRAVQLLVFSYNTLIGICCNKSEHTPPAPREGDMVYLPTVSVDGFCLD